ncbi:helix-turn-helix domain-containing protein [Methanobrevibacter millerae]|uniref:Transcriptional regulator, contains XRE-family HTH domain n=1 Tax=Methanobrevibacter millerae TaxID=230361 RepID=A0A1G5W4H4_9EURY|nr:helix-turn-helix transcriptional regulator [Methanobrevibacter millerae]SDA52844.1 Transcriptional regulator, contains XRE-family HTH domain [Methanobrevibacter millerae]
MPNIILNNGVETFRIKIFYMRIRQGDKMVLMYERLKQLREENNYSQEQVANYLEIDQSYISKIEKGKRNLNEISFNKLCLLYNCSSDYLLGKSNAHEPPKLAFRSDESVDLFAIAKMNQVIGYLKYLRKIERKIEND